MWKTVPNAVVNFSLYRTPEDWSKYFKTWLLKVISCPVRCSADKLLPGGYPRTMKCLMLLVWRPGQGFTEVQGRRLLSPDPMLLDRNSVEQLARRSTLPNGLNLIHAFTQPMAPHGPSFLRVDFWNDVYYDDDFANLVLMSVVDTSSLDSMHLRTVSTWIRAGKIWVCDGAL